MLPMRGPLKAPTTQQSSDVSLNCGRLERLGCDVAVQLEV